MAGVPVYSKPMLGTVGFSDPPGDAPPGRAAPERGRDRTRIGRRLLLVEDNRGDARLVFHLLRGTTELVLDHVTTMEAAVGHLAHGIYDAVLLDLRLPDGDGLSLLETVVGEAGETPVVALTALDDDELALSCLDAGAQDYVRKSELSEVVLTRAIERAVSRQRAYQLQRRLEVAERHAALGRLVASVAHEVNNQSAVLLANAEHSRRLVDELTFQLDPELQPALQQLGQLLEDDVEGLRRTASIVRELKVFARGGGAPRSEQIDVDDLAARVVRMVHNALRQRGTVKLSTRSRGHVTGVRHRLAQVLLNLLNNAIEAFDDSTTDAPLVVVRTSREGERIALSVEDNGPGIPAAYFDRLFEPFFTSKAGDLGTGLGLPICAEIVAEMGGEIRVDTEVGRGTCFTVLLPAAATPASDPAPAPVDLVARGRILVIDDDPRVREALQRLISLDHDVVVARGGGDALKQLERDPEFDVILCDLMMPDIDGIDVYEALVAYFPALCDRVVFLSGGAFTDRGQRFLENTGCSVLHKPVTRAELLAAIAQRMRETLH